MKRSTAVLIAFHLLVVILYAIPLWILVSNKVYIFRP